MGNHAEMINFKQHLNESLSSSYPTTKLNDHRENIDYMFYDSIGTQYLVHFTLFHSMESFDVMFTSGPNQTALKTNSSRSPMRVFATVAALIEQVHRRYPSYTIEFSAYEEEPSRVKLYDRLAEKIAKITGGEVRTAFHRDDKKYYVSSAK